MNYHDVLKVVRSLSEEEQLLLIEELTGKLLKKIIHIFEEINF